MPTFTGLRREHKNSRSVAVTDRIAKATITVGGIATIVAVVGVCLFLVWVVLPLLRGGDTEVQAAVARPATGKILELAEDPYRHLGWLLTDDGDVVAFATADGRELERSTLFDPAEVRCVARHRDRLLLGRADGSVAFASVAFANVVSGSTDSTLAAELAPGSVVVDGNRLFERTPEGQWRRQQLEVDHEEPMALGVDAAVVDCDFSEAPNALLIAAVTADGTVHFKQRTSRMDFMTGEEVTELTGSSTALATIAPDLGDTPPDRVMLTGTGNGLLLIWNEGRLVRLDTRDHEAPQLAETLRVVDDGREVTSAAFLNGKTTLLVGDDRGDIGAWFGTKPVGAGTVDGVRFVRARTFVPPQPSPVVSLDASSRSRLVVAGYADGHVRLWQGTSRVLVTDVALPDGAALQTAALAPKDDGLLAAGSQRLHRYDLHPGHHEVSLQTAFLPVWYEGESEPVHVWQSTGGSDDFEPKLGLWPLIYGTLKATFYCLLFGVPLALLAAIYTSEFLHPRSRARVKPLIELMASLPSVVLGFLAGIVFAPWVAEHLVAVLLAVPAIPFVLLLGAQLWQQAPPWLRPTVERLRVPAAMLAVPTGIWLAAMVAPLAESVLFGGDFKDWLAVATRAADDPERGSAFGGWLLVSIPFAALFAMIVVGRVASGWRGNGANLRRFGLGAVAAVAIGCGLSAALTGVGFDLRGSLFGTFDPRNSLVVGIAMGFAVVPIIYTIAEDALSAVPEHLRAASLGAGATPWQTAVRVILPTAMSGVFSAIMVGLGRAVGETMIVVMAVGGTPIMDISVFNGFRTLSANIATELPEAVRDSSHYRMLYLAALCLFAMTFVLNTVAEVVRQRFRKRAFQL